MNCDQARPFLSAYLDSELEPTPSLEIARHLEFCASCRARFDAEARLEKGIAAALEREGRDPAALARVMAFVDGLGTGRPARGAARIGRRRLALAAALIAVAAVAALLARALFRPDPPAAPGHVEMDLAAEVHDHHRRFLDGTLVPAEDSGSLPAANGIFRKGLPFPLTLGPPESAEFSVGGALCCKFRGTPAACLQARLGGTDVSVFAIAETGLDRFPMARERFAARGDEVHCTVEGLDFVMVRRAGVVLTAIGKAAAAELFALARQLAPGG